MKNSFYTKYAFESLKRNKQMNIPFLLSCIFSVAMYYIMQSLYYNDGLKTVEAYDQMKILIGLGGYITIIFLAIFLIYTNSIVIKQRKKEFGMLNILGLGKKQISYLILCETLYTAIISFTIGLVIGLILEKLMYLCIVNLMHVKIKFGFKISPEAFGKVFLLFTLVFVILAIYNILHVSLTKPVELLKGENSGEKEPKAKIPLAILGLILLGAGYAISITCKSPTSAMMYVFVAILLVMAGTYLLFMTGTIAFLKILKKNKKYYYKPNHFISVSGMIYRMKQNAAGLANICILSTCVLVCVSTTASMLVGMENMLDNQYPYDLSLSFLYNYEDETDDNLEKIEKYIDNGYKKHITKEIGYKSMTFASESTNIDYQGNVSGDYIVNILPLDDYNNLFNENETLSDNEVLYYSKMMDFTQNNVSLFGVKYDVKGKMKEDLSKTGNKYNFSQDYVSNLTFVVPSGDKFIETIKNYTDNSEDIMLSSETENRSYDFDSEKVSLEVSRNVNDMIDNGNYRSYLSLRSKAIGREGTQSIYGSFIFVGLFCGGLFLIATVLMIYYKQVSEGLDDRKRFKIMHNVGLSNAEIKKTIHSQVLTVFFLPLITAGIHLGFAFPIMRKCLVMLGLTNIKLYLICSIIMYAIFALLYILIYSITAKVYEKLVHCS